ncbi:MAG: MATE family efflux transporter [Clostridiaceae bacterium]
MLKKETVKDVLNLALPAVGEMILYMMIGFFDTMMVGNFGGKVAVSSVGLSSEIIYSLVNVFISMGLSIGITSLVARSFGRNDYEKAEIYGSLGFLFGAILSIFITIFIFSFSESILKLAGASKDVIFYGTQYMKIISLGIFFNMNMSLLNGYLRGLGNTKTPLIASLIINIINISLDYILIFGKLGFPSLGIKGAAIATTIAQFVGFIFILFYIKFISKYKIKLSYIKNIKQSLKEIIYLSIPSSLQEAALDLARLLSAFFIIHLGTIAFSANQITTTIESISFMPGWGFAVACTTLVGHKVGEGNYKKAYEYAVTCTILGFIIMTLCSVIFLLIPNVLINLFISGHETNVISLGGKCLMIAAIEQPFIAVSMILSGALKGKGDTKTPFVISLITNWLIRIPLLSYFIFYLNFNITYVWWITALQWFIDSILILIFFRKKFHHIS